MTHIIVKLIGISDEGSESWPKESKINVSIKKVTAWVFIHNNGACNYSY